jgi:hypothetical protein
VIRASKTAARAVSHPCRSKNTTVATLTRSSLVRAADRQHP